MIDAAVAKTATDDGRDSFQYGLLTFEDSKAYLAATSAAMSIETSVLANVAETGMILIPVQKLRHLIAKVNGIITISGEWDKVELAWGKDRHSFSVPLASTFPRLQDVAGEGFFVSGSQIARFITRTIGACDPTSTQYALGGCRFSSSAKRLQVASYDGVEVSAQWTPVTEDLTFLDTMKPIVPQRFLAAIKRLVSVENDVVRVEFGNGRASFRFGDSTVSGPLLQGRFPDADRILLAFQKTTEAAMVDPRELSDAIARVEMNANELTKAVQITMSSDEISVGSGKSETGSGVASCTAKYSGLDQTIWVSGVRLSRILKDVAAHLEKDELVSISRTNEGNQLAVRATGFISAVCRVAVAETMAKRNEKRE